MTLDKLKALAAKATPGPWGSHGKRWNERAAAPPPQPATDMVMVPREITTKMRQEAARANDAYDGTGFWLDDIYAALLAAAPPPQPVTAEVVAQTWPHIQAYLLKWGASVKASLCEADFEAIAKAAGGVE